jgi:hypothetical protein
LIEQRLAGLVKERQPFVIWRRYRLAARLHDDLCGQRQQLAAFKAKRRRLLALAAALIDLSRNVDGL